MAPVATVGSVPIPSHCLVAAHSTSESRCSTSSARPRHQFLKKTANSGSTAVAAVMMCRSRHIDISHQSCRGALAAARLEVVDFSGGVTDNDAANANEQSNGDGFLSVHAMAPVMKKGYGAFGGATLEKSKLDLSQSTSRVSPQTEDGGGGGDIGNKINHGGGDGGDDGGDDDDYFGDADDDDEGDDGGFFKRRLALPEVFDRKIVEAILQEWYRTVSDLPAGLRQAVELGFISSAQMVRFISNFGRPTLARLMSRAVPPSISRAFIGRMIADPGFLYKMCWEQAVTIAYGAWWEVKNRKERLKDEWGLAVVDILSLSLCNAAIVWSLAPCRSYGSTFKFSLQNTIQKLPNNVFERSYAFREFNMAKRFQSVVYKAGELCLTGLLVGAAGGGVAKLLASGEERTSVPTASVRTSALSYGAFLGLTGNLRYQSLYGLERVMQENFNHISVVVIGSAALRALNIYLGDATRLAWLGLDGAPDLSIEGLKQAYRRPSLEAENPVKNWSFEKMFSFLSSGKSGPTKTRTPTRRKVKRKVMVAS